ncbi:carbamate kinase [Alistipes sp. ZOR0009]|jgi:carbamate kinase|uniref:carbamate kinase n=1 Tax=Alistipes sp. ZOR0009 TaxID=1339253 RepID=UPI0006476745|nr:carbamate kinase [Alistipes sp. ZOR0009]
MSEKKLAVIALGGNALLRGNQKGTIEEQEQNATDTLENIVFLLRQGYNLVISHGNGPQVGNMLLQNDAGEQVYSLPQMPIDVCVADTQGSIGYIIERALRNVLKKYEIEREIVTLITPVLVDINDPAFSKPTKRVGRVYSKEEADRLTEAKGWVFKEEIKDTISGWRRVVPSPEPKGILNEKVIENMANSGFIVIASGGGGIPVYYDEHGTLRPAEAVIDKDLASSLLGGNIKAHEFYILTDVPYIYLNYKQPNQAIAEFLNHADTMTYLEQGMFGEGSMAPKIRAALKFIENGGQKSIITEATKLEDKKYGSKITMEYNTY